MNRFDLWFVLPVGIEAALLWDERVQVDNFQSSPRDGKCTVSHHRADDTAKDSGAASQKCENIFAMLHRMRSHEYAL
jgi:hypothetical protein